MTARWKSVSLSQNSGKPDDEPGWHRSCVQALRFGALRPTHSLYRQKEPAMLDLLFVLLLLGSFAACLAYTVGCERL
jgi:hypothetical protein